MYNDAHMLEKILKEKRKELGPLAEDDDVASPKLKLSKATSYIAMSHFNTYESPTIQIKRSSF